MPPSCPPQMTSLLKHATQNVLPMQVVPTKVITQKKVIYTVHVNQPKAITVSSHNVMFRDQ